MRCMTEPIRRELIGCGIPWEQITELRLLPASFEKRVGCDV